MSPPPSTMTFRVNLGIDALEDEVSFIIDDRIHYYFPRRTIQESAVGQRLRQEVLTSCVQKEEDFLYIFSKSTRKGNCCSWKKIVKSLDKGKVFQCFFVCVEMSKRDPKPRSAIQNVKARFKMSKREPKHQSASKCQPKC